MPERLPPISSTGRTNSRRTLYTQELSAFCAFARLGGGPAAAALPLETLGSILSELLGDALANDGSWNPTVRLWVFRRGLVQLRKRMVSPSAPSNSDDVPTRGLSDLERLLAPLYGRFLLTAPRRWSSTDIRRFESTFRRLPGDLQSLLNEAVLVGTELEGPASGAAKRSMSKILQARKRLTLLWNHEPSA